MIVLDTHIWIWWIHSSSRLDEAHRALIALHQDDEIGISAISCWEVAMLASAGRLPLPSPTQVWLETALSIRGVRLLPLSPAIAIESTVLPSEFHKDPADRIIVATSRIHNCALMTADAKILAYPHVKLAIPEPPKNEDN